ncbi:MAG TPA: UDP-N-acetylmuramoyl-L-alanyl-D-glutamate--2,6-diaminopimelate ligase [Candidatus Eisenbacteria bacterium]|nr:UDP-N-acetylmuramoyl-L-alanyl-D-glutamate--2,6-diaminopimelate ligase [Candidatus Eisenbacteria bacterium]
MTLRQLVEEMDEPEVRGDAGVTVTGLAYDSRRVRPGDVFFGLSGLRHEGAGFVRQAFASGAAAAVVARGAALPPPTGPLVRVAEPRRALAQAAACFNGHPSRALALVGVTGTNGKTTTTWLVAAMLEAHGRACGIVGTTGIRFGRELRPSPFTTPEAPELQAVLRELVEANVPAAALELSSHALHQRRCYAVECDATVFTNLTHDHLDYHGTLEAYLDAKRMLFDGRNGPTAKRVTACINADDPAGARVAEAAGRGGQRVWRYGEAGAELRIAAARAVPGGLDVEFVDGLRAPAETHRFVLPMLGRHNAWNAAAAWLAARALDVPAGIARRALASFGGVPGRLERVERGQPYEVVVDYAHTPDALARALDAAREHARGRVLVVFGCGGDRDRAKRPVMGGVAAARADHVWVTSDNPRSEDPAAIAAEVARGAGDAAEVELDRRAAIGAALAAARAGDVVLIAGKGHETTQTIGDRVLPFDDREVARAWLTEHVS